ncbi:DUF2167 domain-containing protein [Paenibacillus antarcticus]|uniref:DUF2167 domain-containing protein n=1 Tax=Paenibacillus antarcticus TaxID=253703 RepID=UPI00083995B9|nr:DUF2167 domain-containing protein [Paenibacillus antarcticus]
MVNRRHGRFRTNRRSISFILAFIMAVCVIMTASGVVHADTDTQTQELNWVEGSGQEVGLGSIAKLKLQTGLQFLDKDDTIASELSYGGVPSNKEIGSVYTTDPNATWAVFFDYDDVGHIADDEKNDIDADALLQSYKEGTEAANKETTEENHLFVDGWDVPPTYDDNLHSLKWSLLAHDNNNETLINYNVRILTKEGYISAILVSDPTHLAEDRKAFENIVLSNFSVNSGEGYADFDESTDRLAEIGLTGLIVGGAGLVVAKKVGLIAMLVVLVKKFGIVIVVAVAGLFKYLRRGRKKDETSTPNHDNDAPPPIDSDYRP